MLMNEHSLLSHRVRDLIMKSGKQCSRMAFLKERKKEYAVFEGLPEGPSIARDGKKNSCVDLVIPYKDFNLIVQITCQKDYVVEKAKQFYDRIARYANSKTNECKANFYDSSLALFISIHPLEKSGFNRCKVDEYLEQPLFMLLELVNEHELFPNLDIVKMTEDITVLQQWLKSGCFMNTVGESRHKSPPPSLLNLEDKIISPHGRAKKATRESQRFYYSGCKWFHHSFR